MKQSNSTMPPNLQQAVEATRRDLGLSSAAPVNKLEVLRRHPPVKELARFVKGLLADDGLGRGED